MPPINPGNRKVLLFTAFADTAQYLYKNLAQTMLKDHGVHTAVVTGTGGPKSTLDKHYDFQSVLTLFSPKAKEKALTMPEVKAELDLLIGTDCISGRQNLQDCDYVINYDIHWNGQTRPALSPRSLMVMSSDWLMRRRTACARS
ncbi:MAG: helicase-related protein [Phycisphaerales bacterium]